MKNMSMCLSLADCPETLEEARAVIRGREDVVDAMNDRILSLEKAAKHLRELAEIGRLAVHRERVWDNAFKGLIAETELVGAAKAYLAKHPTEKP